MPETARVYGTVMLRPLLGAFVESKLDLPDIRRIVGQASAHWGGAHYPIVKFSNNMQGVDNLLRSLGVDFSWTESRDEELKDFCNRDGFSWIGGAHSGPFGAAVSDYDDGPIDTAWLLHTIKEGSIQIPKWDENDPLANLFAVMFGSMEATEFTESQLEQFTAALPSRHISSATPLTELLDLGGILATTQLELARREKPRGLEIVSVDVQNPSDLIQFWNLRAYGFNVIPLPIGFEDSYADEIISIAKLRDELEVWRRGNGEDIRVLQWWAASEVAEPPAAVEQIARALGAEVHHGIDDPSVLRRLNYRPGHTYFERTFDASASPSDWSFKVALPSLPWKHSRPTGGFYVGRVAADIQLLSESGVSDDRSAKMPHYRRLARMLRARAVTAGVNPIRPRGDGRVYGIQARQESLDLDFIPSLQMFRALVDDDEWKLGQSDEGHFASRLGVLLGGATSYVANQPALRVVFEAASRKGVSGISLAAIRGLLENFRGDWPDGLFQATAKQYAEQESRRLLNSKLLRPVMPIKCPSCRSTLALSPAQVQEDIVCDFCSETFTLGLALSLANKHPTWGYRLATHVSVAQIVSALPMLATVSLLARLERGGVESIPHVLGLTIEGPKGRKMEADVAAFVNDHRPVVVVGEVKNCDDITATDVDNLYRFYEKLHDTGTDALVMIATLKETLSDDEKRILRTHMTRSRFSVESLEPREVAFPLIFTKHELSANPWSEDHPWHRSKPGQGHMSLFGLARDSCMRYLDMTDDELSAIEKANWDAVHGAVLSDEAP
jgi:hypothetical protein